MSTGDHSPSASPQPVCSNEFTTLDDDQDFASDHGEALFDGLQDGDDLQCLLCNDRLKKPRLLDCLHEFCTECLKDQFDNHAQCLSGRYVIACPLCKQDSSILPKDGVDALHLDYVLNKLLDMESVGLRQIACTSCSSGDASEAHCSSCSNYLCSGCFHAHKNMRIFESHQVVSLDILQKEAALALDEFVKTNTLSPPYKAPPTPTEDTIKKSKTFDRKLFCLHHADEVLKFFCKTCQTPICNACLVTDHRLPQHDSVLIDSAFEQQQIMEIKTKVVSTVNKRSTIDSNADAVNTVLGQLDKQKDTITRQILNTYKSHVEEITKKKDDLISSLAHVHDKMEEELVNQSDQLEQILTRLEHSQRFCNRLLEQGNALEILQLKRLVMDQLKRLENHLGANYINPNISIDFNVDCDRFRQAIKIGFGSLNRSTSNTLTSARILDLSDEKLPNANSNDQTLAAALNEGHGNFYIGNGSTNDGKFRGGLGLLPRPTISSRLSINAQPFSIGNVLEEQPNTFPESGKNVFNSGNSAADIAQQLMLPQTGVLSDHAAVQIPTSNVIRNTHARSDALTVPTPPLSRDSQQRNDFNALTNYDSLFNIQHSSGQTVTTTSPISNEATPGLNDLATMVLNHMGQFSGSSGPGSGIEQPVSVTSVGHPSSTNNYLGVTPATSTMNSTLVSEVVRPSLPSSPSVSANVRSLLYDNHNPPGFLDGMSEGNELAIQKLVETFRATRTTHPSSIDVNSLPPAAAAYSAAASGMPWPHYNPLTGSFIPPLPRLPLPPPSLPPVAPSSVSASSSVTDQTGSKVAPVIRSGKAQSMQIRSKFGQLGNARGQFNSPHGFCLGVDEEVIVADTNNHRIQVFDKQGDFKMQFGEAGKDEGQLWYPRKVAVFRDSGKFVICDRGSERSRMQIFTKTGQFLRKITIRYIDIVAGLGVTSNGTIVAVDSVSPSVFLLSESGEQLKWFDCSSYMSEPSDIAVARDKFYVCDFKGHQVVVFSENGDFLRKIGTENITNYPNGIDVSDAGDILVGDSHGNRFHVAVFQNEGGLIGEFECPYVKVSRCCGLKITSEGYIVTLAKNNHHVLVLNTLYIN